jgi:hypothetical protein
MDTRLNARLTGRAGLTDTELKLILQDMAFLLGWGGIR